MSEDNEVKHVWPVWNILYDPEDANHIFVIAPYYKNVGEESGLNIAERLNEIIKDFEEHGWDKTVTVIIASIREQLLLNEVGDEVIRARMIKALLLKDACPSRIIKMPKRKPDDVAVISAMKLNTDIVSEALKFGSLESLRENKRYVIGFCDFINSTDLLSMTSTCFFRSIQNKIISRLAEVITDSGKTDSNNQEANGSALKYWFPGIIDKFAGDNIMFYFDIAGLKDQELRDKQTDDTRTIEEKDVYRAIFSTVTKMLYKFSSVLDEIAKDESPGGENKHCPLCGKCENDMRRQDCLQKFRNFKGNLGLRIGLTLSTKPLYHSTLGIAVSGDKNFETDYTFTGEDVNLAARLESMKEETMLAELERGRNELSSYIGRLYDTDNKESTSIMKKRETLNIQADDIYAISRANLSLRINDALYREFKKYIDEPGEWKTLSIHPKGLIGTEKIHVLHGKECRRQAIEPGKVSADACFVPEYRYILY